MIGKVHKLEEKEELKISLKRKEGQMIEAKLERQTYGKKNRVEQVQKQKRERREMEA